MKLWTTGTVTSALGLSRARIEQWFSRGFFRTPHNPINGAAREWTIGDAFRLAVCGELVDAGLSAADAGRLTEIPLHGFNNDVAFFLAYKGKISLAIKDTATGKPLKADFEGWRREIVRGSELKEFLSEPDIRVATVVVLDHLWPRVEAALGAAE